MDRPLQIVFRDIQHSASLAKLIEERVQRLEHVHDHIIGCRVVAGAAHRGLQQAIMPLALTVEVEVPGRPLIVAKADAKKKGEQAGLVNRVFDAVQRRLEQVAEITKGNVKRHENALEFWRRGALVPRPEPRLRAGEGRRGSLFHAQLCRSGQFRRLANRRSGADHARDDGRCDGTAGKLAAGR